MLAINALLAILRQEGYSVTCVSAASAASEPDKYPRRRSELWFTVAERARLGQIYLGRLDAGSLRRLKQQLMAPAWDLAMEEAM